MDQAKMARDDEQDSPDDLIAELARLMAEDAQGEKPREPQEKGRQEETRQEETRQETAPHQEELQANAGRPSVARPDNGPDLSSTEGRFEAEDPFKSGPAERFVAEQAPRSMPHEEAGDELTGFEPADDGSGQHIPFSLQAEEDEADNIFARLAAQLETIEHQASGAGTAHVAHNETVQQAAEPIAPAPEQAPSPGPHEDAGDPIADLIAADAETTADDESPDFPYEQDETGRQENETGRQENADRPGTVENNPAADLRDSFSVAPVFGLGGATKARAPQAPAARPSVADKGGDPINEIEALIGEAVKSGWQEQRAPSSGEAATDAEKAVEAAITAAEAPQAKGRSAQSPEAKSAEGATRPSDEDILAGIFAGKADRPATGKTPTSARSGAGLRAFAVPAALGLILILGIGGGAWYFMRPGDTDQTAPVLSSNTQGAKVEAANTTPSGNDQQSIVFDQLSSDNGTANTANNEQLVSRDQSTATTANAGADASGTDVRQVGEGTSSDSGEMTLTNRKVRTVTVRPDGTIVTEDDGVAGNQELGVARPNVPSVPGDASTGNFQVASAETAGTAAADGAGTASTAAADGAALVENAPFPAPRLSEAQRVQLASAESSAALTATQPAAASSNTNAVDLLAGVANQTASQAPAASATASANVATAPSDGVNAPAYVQLSSQRGVDAANTTLTEMNRRYSSFFGGAQAFVRQVELGDKGTFYRVLVPAGSFDAATSMCTSIKNAGGDCFVRTE